MMYILYVVIHTYFNRTFLLFSSKLLSTWISLTGNRTRFHSYQPFVIFNCNVAVTHYVTRGRTQRWVWRRRGGVQILT